MRLSLADAGHERIATLDIETTHWKPRAGETVSIGLGVHDRGTPGEAATYETLHRDGRGEVTLIERALSRLDDLDADALVSYNGRAFDLDFLRQRLALQGTSYAPPAIDTPETHVDLFERRQALCEETGDQWPTLEACLEAYGYPRPTTTWKGADVTNARFGEELGPAYLEAVRAGDDERASTLADVIDHYLITDLEANVAIYYADVGAEFTPAHLGAPAAFP